MYPVNPSAAQRGREIKAENDLAFARAHATAQASGRQVSKEDYLQELAVLRAVLPPPTKVEF